MISEQQVIRVPVKHDGYPDSCEPPHRARGDDWCAGCDGMRKRRARNHRAGKYVGVSVRGSAPQEQSGSCSACKAPCFAAEAGTVKAWAWNFDVDRAQWGIEPRDRNYAHPKGLCPRCRPKE